MTSTALCVPAENGDSDSGVIREGLAEVLSVTSKRKDGKAAQEVFYNPPQVFNRDLSVLVLSVFAKLRAADMEERRKKREQKAKESGRPLKESPPPGLKLLEALAATGIRSIRYAKELGEGAEGVREIVANDLDATAVEHIKKNLVHNKVPEGRIVANCADANSHMYGRRARGFGGIGDDAYDVIDLDPYGTASPFLDAAVQAVADGGLLCITSTDMPILGGNNPETCFARYGGTALKAGYVHEMSLRLLVHAVATSAAKYGREARPMLSCSIDFYVRIFVRVFDSPARVKQLASKTGVVHQCVQCESFFVQPFGDATSSEANPKFKPARVVTPGQECPECAGCVKLGGPFHVGPLYDSDFAALCLEACDEDERDKLPGVTSWRKITGMITAITEEERDLPLHYRLPQLCKGLKLPPIPLRQFRGTLVNLGYRVSHFHRDPEAVKTDAPNAVVYDLMRVWAEENTPKSTPLPNILKKEVSLKRPVEWITEEEMPRSKVARFLPNPEKNWGPKHRAKGSGGAEDTPDAVLPLTDTLEAADVATSANKNEPDKSSDKQPPHEGAGVTAAEGTPVVNAGLTVPA